MSHKFDPRHAGRLDDPERRRFLDPARISTLLELRPGEVVADVGCGTAYFTLELARAVGPEGKVYALDISEELLARAGEKVAAAGMDNVALVLSREVQIPLPGAQVDAALLANVLHEVGEKEAFLAEVGRVIRPAGRLLVVEWKKIATPKGPPVDHRLEPGEVIALAGGAGFSGATLVEIGPYHYGVGFTAGKASSGSPVE